LPTYRQAGTQGTPSPPSAAIHSTVVASARAYGLAIEPQLICCPCS
jgi:hypothetical protein